MSSINEGEFPHHIEAKIRRRQRWGVVMWALGAMSLITTITIARLICH